MTDAVQLAEGVLLASDDVLTALSLAPGMPQVTASSSVADARRNYMRLAALLHPDKLQDRFDRATDAFQTLVRAFEQFADPRYRKKIVARMKRRPTEAVAPALLRPEGQEGSDKVQPRKASRKTPRKQVEAESETESESEASSEEDEDDDLDDFVSANQEPTVSTSRTAIGQPRVGPLYRDTTIGCPKCRTVWTPDAKTQYSLFMGPWGQKVHCQLCLFTFGCATAYHYCPHCEAPFEYDASLYDSTIHCVKCKKEFGFPYYPVNQMLVDRNALEAWREEHERAKAHEREERARRRGAGNEESEELQLAIGTCAMNGECPLCHKRINRSHRAHVEMCWGLSPKERGSGAVTTASRAATRRTSSAKVTTATTPSSRTKGTTKPPAKAKAPATRKKRRREEDSPSESEGESSLLSESSFSESDYSSD